MKDSAFFSRYAMPVADTFSRFLRPQESGNHCDVSEAILSDKNGNALAFSSGTPFCFGARPFSLERLCRAAHDEELADEALTQVSIDGFMSGWAARAAAPAPGALPHSRRSPPRVFLYHGAAAPLSVLRPGLPACGAARPKFFLASAF